MKTDTHKYVHTSLAIPLATAVFAASLLLAGCGEDDIIQAKTDTTVPNAGIVADKNFSVLTADVAPAVYDVSTQEFTRTEVEITAYIGDRNNQTLTDLHTIFFEVDYGLIEPSCDTDDGRGFCSVTWVADKNPTLSAGGLDGFVNVTAYTLGEESFDDANGNGTFDDGETFTDVEEPFVNDDGSFDAFGNETFTAADKIIDVPSTRDPAGNNGSHDIPNGLFDGAGCSHSTLCSSRTTVFVYDTVRMSMFTASFTVSGTVSGIPVGETATIQLNGGEAIDLTSSSTNFLFGTSLGDGDAYAVTITDQPDTATCTLFNDSGNISGTNVGNVAIVCT